MERVRRLLRRLRGPALPGVGYGGGVTWGRQYPDGPLEVPPGWPEAASGFLQNMLGGDMEPGPPHVHTYWPPEPDYDEDGNEIWPEPGPAITIEDSAPGFIPSAARL